MAVQKRYQTRLEINREIQLIYRKRAFTAYATDLSSEGMGLKIEALSIPTGMFLELDLQINGEHWQIPAVITHCSPNNLGVMFLAKQDRLYSTLLKQHEEEKQPQAPQILSSPFQIGGAAVRPYQ